ncbi:MAG: 4a-hydroxytetrahydrobiopterin dehydratase [Candidatus Omnitrophica bacterium]|nr:4a-hydroxytetrahydrobiopterin dehydratase [Candidatus Omnitrophota bacterium]
MDANPLKDKKCHPCEAGSAPLSDSLARKFLQQTPGWKLDESGQSIFRDYTTKSFRAAVALIQSIADVAEAADHHPDLHLTDYRKLRVVLSTHAIGGLSENDFIVAAKIGALKVELKK